MRKLLLVAVLVGLSGAAHAGGPQDEFLPGPPKVVVNAVMRPGPLPAARRVVERPPAPPPPAAALLIWELRPNATARAGHLGP